MKRKSVKGKKISHSRKKKRFFSEKYPLVALGILTLFCITLMFAAIGNSTGNAITGYDTSDTVSVTAPSGNSALDNSLPDFLTKIANFFNLPANSIKEFIIGLIVLAIIFAGVYDILELTSIFSNDWVLVIIAAGLSLVAALVDWVRKISITLIEAAAVFGALAIYVEIAISLIVFIGLAFGGTWFAQFAAKRRAQAIMIRAIKGTGKAVAGLRTAKAFGEEAARGSTK